MINPRFWKSVKLFVTLAALSVAMPIAHHGTVHADGGSVQPDQANLKATFEHLLGQTTRPTMLQIQEALPALASERINLVNNQRGASIEPWLGILLRYTPSMIAAMEYTYPGATWVFLGRDSMALADAIEGFYMSLGQTDRVVRVGVSKATFQGATRTQLVEFLEGYGLNAKAIATNHASPFIFVDTISSGYGNQGRTLIGSVYESYRDNGGEPADLLRKVNLFGLQVSTFRGAAQPFEQSQAFFNRQDAIYRGQPIQDYVASHQIVTYPQQPEFANEAGYEHFTLAWHGSYGPLQKLPGTNILRAQEGPATDVNTRKSILWLQEGLWNGTQRQSFLAEVQFAAMDLGYSFPLKRMGADERPRALHLAGLSDQALRELMETNSTWISDDYRELNIAARMGAFMRKLRGDGGVNAYTEFQTFWNQLQASGESPQAAVLGGVRTLRRLVSERYIQDSHIAALLAPVLARARPSSVLVQELVSFGKENQWALGAIDTIANVARVPNGNPARMTELLEANRRYMALIGSTPTITKEQRLAEMKSELQKRLASAEVAPEKRVKGYFQVNAKEIANWLDSALATAPEKRTELVLDFNQISMAALRGGKIDKIDARRLVALGFAEADEKDAAYINGLRDQIQGNAELRHIVTSKAWSFVTDRVQDAEDVERTFRVVMRDVLRPMNCELVLTPPEEPNDVRPRTKRQG